MLGKYQIYNSTCFQDSNIETVILISPKFGISQINSLRNSVVSLRKEREVAPLCRGKAACLSLKAQLVAPSRKHVSSEKGDFVNALRVKQLLEMFCAKISTCIPYDKSGWIRSHVHTVDYFPRVPQLLLSQASGTLID